MWSKNPKKQEHIQACDKQFEQSDTRLELLWLTLVNFCMKF